MGFMETLKRIPKILEANLNDLLDKAEDPEKMIDQLLRDYREDLAEVKANTAEVKAIASEAKRDLDNLKAEIAQKATAAQNALKAGNEEDCKKIIAMKQEAEARLPQLQQNYDIAAKNDAQMTKAYNELVSRIKTLEAKKDTVKSTIKIAKAQEKQNDMVAHATSIAANDTFDKYEKEAQRRLDAAQAEANLNASVTADEDLVDKYATASSASVDDEFAKMKAELGM